MLHIIKSARKIQTCPFCRRIYGSCYWIDGINGYETENQRFYIRRSVFGKPSKCTLHSASVHLPSFAVPMWVLSSFHPRQGWLHPRAIHRLGPEAGGGSETRFGLLQSPEEENPCIWKLHGCIKMLRASLDWQQHMIKCYSINSAE